MKIGIFGDSFGDDSEKPKGFRSWIDIIREQSHEVDNYSAGGSSIWYSYNNIIKKYQKYDKIIFLVTEPQRISLPKHSSIIWKHMTVKFITDLFTHPVETWFTTKHKSDINVLYEYFHQIHDYDQHTSMAELMMKDIQSNYSKVILYPCFSNSPYATKDVPLIEANNYELSQLDLKKKPANMHLDARICHFKESNHKLIAKLFIDRLNGIESILNLKDFELATEPVSQYFRREGEIVWVK